jgi:hypothetical protein
MPNPNGSNATELRDQLHRDLLSRRREFLKRTLLTCAYVAPVAMSFASQDLARAASCPGVGNCGNSQWAPQHVNRGSRHCIPQTCSATGEAAAVA